MRMLCIILLSILLLACSNTKVNLYSRYLTNADIKKISLALENNNFTVISNTYSFPDEIQQSTILYSLFINNKQSLTELVNSLFNLGFRIDNVKPLVAGNHWYTKNSVGLFILPKGIKQHDKIANEDLVNNYESRNCNTLVSIQLNKDNTYKILTKENINERTDYLEGLWKISSYPYVELISFNERWVFYFEIEQSVEVDKISEIQIVSLNPQDNYLVFPKCSFAYGVRK